MIGNRPHQRLHQHDIDHRRFVDDQQVAVERIVVAALEVTRIRVDFEQPVRAIARLLLSKRHTDGQGLRHALATQCSFKSIATFVYREDRVADATFFLSFGWRRRLSLADRGRHNNSVVVKPKLKPARRLFRLGCAGRFSGDGLAGPCEDGGDDEASSSWT